MTPLVSLFYLSFKRFKVLVHNKHPFVITTIPTYYWVISFNFLPIVNLHCQYPTHLPSYSQYEASFDHFAFI